MTVSGFETNILASSYEFLYENSNSGNEKTYQLFHESLREYLIERFSETEINAWNEKLVNYCSNWVNEQGDWLLAGQSLHYALNFAALHLYDSWKSNLNHNNKSEALKRRQALLVLIDSEKWRQASFEVLGNANALKKAYPLCQKVLLAADEEGQEAKNQTFQRIVGYSFDMHNEPLLMYSNQRKRLNTPIPLKQIPTQVENTIRLANMGETPASKLLLLYTALWASNWPQEILTGRLTTQVEQWLDLAQEKSLTKLWEYAKDRI